MSFGIDGKTGDGVARLKGVLAHLFAEKEIFFRSRGRMRFVRIRRRTQIIAAAVLLLLAGAWLATALVVLHESSAAQRDQASARAAAARTAAAATRRIDAYQRSVGSIADDIRRRQDMLDDMVRSQFGPGGATPEVVGPGDEARPQPDTATPARARTPRTLSAAQPADTLHAVAARQSAFARRLAALVDRRAEKAAAAIRSFGLDPKRIAAGRTAALGGPYIPWPEEKTADDRAMTALARSFARLNALERGLLTIPSGRPTASPMLTSSYGYRRDPFNGRAAFHAGLDFPGHSGQPILAAAAGRVAYVGQRQGYGNVVEIDHGHGLLTRYAHLSGFVAQGGESVRRGQIVGRMGSTGRSTGPHLHFEVRLNGNPIDPRRFLEVRDDVRKSQQVAKRRLARLDTGADGRS